MQWLVTDATQTDSGVAREIIQRVPMVIKVNM